KEIPADIVRWHGARKVEAFLSDLYHVAKDHDPDGLVTYTNFPTTEYRERPLVLREFGMCSFRHGRDGQADFLDWQIEEIFDHGLAGAVVFGWTDPFYQDNTLIDDWGFGLVAADRRE